MAFESEISYPDFLVLKCNLSWFCYMFLSLCYPDIHGHLLCNCWLGNAGHVYLLQDEEQNDWKWVYFSSVFVNLSVFKFIIQIPNVRTMLLFCKLMTSSVSFDFDQAVKLVLSGKDVSLTCWWETLKNPVRRNVLICFSIPTANLSVSSFQGRTSLYVVGVVCVLGFTTSFAQLPALSNRPEIVLSGFRSRALLSTYDRNFVRVSPIHLYN